MYCRFPLIFLLFSIHSIFISWLDFLIWLRGGAAKRGGVSQHCSQSGNGEVRGANWINWCWSSWVAPSFHGLESMGESTNNYWRSWRIPGIELWMIVATLFSGSRVKSLRGCLARFRSAKRNSRVNFARKALSARGWLTRLRSAKKELRNLAKHARALSTFLAKFTREPVNEAVIIVNVTIHLPLRRGGVLHCNPIFPVQILDEFHFYCLVQI